MFKGKLLLLVSYLIWSMPSYSIDIVWSGYGSIVGGQTVHEQVLPSGASTTFGVDPSLTGKQGATYRDVLSFSPDTMLALQLNVDLKEGLSVTSQLTSRGGSDFNLEAEWLYVSYEVTPQLILKAGKQRSPLYLFSDYLDVAYSYHWLRPPLNVYGEGVTTYQGISAAYNGYFGDFDYYFNIDIGSSHVKSTSLGELTLENMVEFSSTFSNESLTFRLAYTRAVAWLDESILVGLELAPGQPVPIFSNKDKPSGLSFSSVALFYDPGKYFIGGEITVLGALDNTPLQSGLTGTTFDSRDSWMLTSGIRIGKFTPHISLSERITMLTGDVIEIFNDLESGSKSLIVGARYDFHPKAALKFDYTSRQDISSDLLQNISGKTKEVDVISAGIDFIF